MVVERAATNLRALAEMVVAAGKLPIIPTIPWGATASIQAHGLALNEAITAIVRDTAAVAGPDLWSLFEAAPALMGEDGVHPTPEGYAQLRRWWADWALEHVYAARPSLRAGSNLLA